MGLFYFLLILCLFLIIVTITSTIIKITLFATTRNNYHTRQLFIPAVLNILIWILLFFGLYSILSAILHVNLFTFIFNLIISKTSDNPSMIKIIISLIITFIIGIALQALTYFCVNIDYKNIFRSTRWFVKKKINYDIDSKKTRNVVLKDDEVKLTYGNAFLASIFSFTLVLFFVLILYNVGTYISGKYS